MFSSRLDPPDDVLLTVRCCHANGEDAADVMLFTLMITGGITVSRHACAGIARPAYLGKGAPYDFFSNLYEIDLIANCCSCLLFQVIKLTEHVRTSGLRIKDDNMSKRLEQRQTQIDQQNVYSLVPSLAGFRPQLNKHIRPKTVWSLQSTTD